MVVRLAAVLGSGLRYYGRYDDGVYYSASEALSFGRIPYKDFVLLHPPGIMLALLPLVWLGRLTSDPIGMAVGRIAFAAIGAINASLVAVLAARWGRLAALIAGIIYACWYPAVYGETSTLLEPIGTLLLLISLIVLIRREGQPARSAELVAGVLLGLSATVKIWYLATWGAVVLWQLAVRRYGSAARIVTAGSVALLAVVVPFYVLAGTRMYDMVIRDQLLRGEKSGSRAGRIAIILGIRPLAGHAGAVVLPLSLLVAVIVLAAAARCLRDRAAVPVVWILGVTFVVLMASPPFFEHYSELTAAPAALVVGIGAALFVRVGTRARRAAVPILIVLALISGVAAALRPIGVAFPRTLHRYALPGCVRADDPSALIELDLLTRDLRQHCALVVDTTGITYDRLHAAGGRPHNQKWQSFLYSYLTSGAEFIIARHRGDGLAHATARKLDSYPLIAQQGGIEVRRGSAAP